jgi:SAM-dependent methyltransferase
MLSAALPVAQCVHCGVRYSTEHLEYGVRTTLLPPDLARSFVQLRRDDEGTEFLRACSSTSTAARLAQSTAAAALRTSLSLTDANALVGRGAMHVLSTEQARLLLRRPGEQCEGVLLDVGAGDGGVTSRLAPLFQHVVATEASAPMARRLQQRSFALALHTLETTAAGLRAAAPASLAEPVNRALCEGFDVVALLNVLDRCDKPLTLLRALRELLRAGSGRLLLAVVLPFRPFVEDGAARRPPSERLDLPPDASFELSLCGLWAALSPLGFALESVTRAPYLSDGDTNCPVCAPLPPMHAFCCRLTPAQTLWMTRSLC